MTKTALLFLLFTSQMAFADEGLKILEKAFVPEFTVVSSELESESKKCTRTRILIETPDPIDLSLKRNIEYVDYTPRNTVKEQIILMPPTGGVSFVDRQLAGKLCKKGVRVLVHYHFSNDTETGLDPTVHERAFIRAITAIKHMALNLQGDYGIIGTSLGSLYSSQALVAEPRITKALFVVGGAPITEVLAYSEQEGLAELRKARMEKLEQKSQTEYLQYLKSNFRLDLLSRLEPTQDLKIWIVRSLDDDTVPTSTQSSLIELLNPDKVTDSKAGHVRTIVNLLFKKSDIIDFFLEQ